MKMSQLFVWQKRLEEGESEPFGPTKYYPSMSGQSELGRE